MNVLLGGSPALNSSLFQEKFSGDTKVFEVVFFGKGEVNKNKSNNY